MLAFELKYHFRQASFLIACFLFLVLGTFAVAKGNFGSEEVYKNSPFVTTYILSFISLFSIFSSTLFCANVVLRDYTYKMDSVIFTTAVNRSSYFFVRFLGLLIAVFTHLAFAALGLCIGTLFVEGDRLGAFNVAYYLHPLFVFGLPNVLLSVSCIFCTAILTKNVRAIYAVGVLLYIIYMVASILGNSPLFANSTLKVQDPSIWPYLLDPYGMTSFFTETKKWTYELRNQRLFPLDGVFLTNRLLWLGGSAFIVFISYTFFNFRLSTTKHKKSKEESVKRISIPFKHFATSPMGWGYTMSTFASQFKLELLSLFKHIPFMVMLLLWLFVFGVELKDSLFNGAYGINVYPTTGMIIEEMRSLNFALILLIFYGAELVGRERSAKIEALIYSTPVRGGALWAAKSLTLGVLVMVLVTLNIVLGMGVQLVNGYYEFDLLTYFWLYYYSAFPLLLFVILIVFIQNLFTNKYVGMLLNLVIIFCIVLGPQFGLSHFLLRFASVPNLQFSYFNGFGHYAIAFNWYNLYWAGLATILGVLTVGFWQRSIRREIYSAKWVLVIGALVWIGSGSFIYHQTNTVGKYRSKTAKLGWQINYEKKYARFIHLPQPIIKSIKTEVDLLLDDRAYTVKGMYRLKNETKQSISKLWLSLHPSVNEFAVVTPNGNNQAIDKEFNQQFIALKKSLAPGEETTLSFSLKVIRNGFVPFDSENSLVNNGSYIELEKFVPHFGFNEGLIIEDKLSRRKAGLSAQLPSSDIDYEYHLVDFETTVSTAFDQHVVTVGALQKTWIANDRRYFNYKTEKPISFMFALSSAVYAVKKEKHQGVAISIYYRKGQEYNVNSMMKAMKDAIAYGTDNFGAYPLKRFVLAEIPQYKGAATAYPGVVFSAEQINFLSNYSNATKVDQAYAITAHEVAHQWWANQLDPAPVAGRAMLTESLAKYTEAAVLEKTFGKLYLRNYLKLDNHIYFANRNPNEKEQSMAMAIDQTYVYYQKGGINMYAVKEAVGEKAFNSVLKKLIVEHGSPHKKATTDDFLRLLKEVAPIDQLKFIEDSFNQVVDYNMSVQVLSVKPIASGEFEIVVQINAGVNKQGSTQLSRPDMDIEVALLDKNSKPFFSKKYRVSDRVTKLTLLTNQKPRSVAIDPYAYLLDANLDDNVKEIK